MTNIKTRPAIHYSRFSTGGQSKGDSIRRQQEAFEQALNITQCVDSGYCYSDLGKSGYKGEHLGDGGELARLLSDLENNRLPLSDRPVIFVEKVDRLGRLPFKKMLSLFTRILDVADVYICADNKLHDNKSDNDFASYLMLAFQNFQAWEESDKKSERILAAKKGALLKAMDSGKPLAGRQYPNWLTLNEDKTAYVTIPERAETIRLMFELYISGLSIRGITTHLNKEKIPSWNNKGESSMKWISGTVRSHLKNSAAIGIFKSRTFKDDLSRTDNLLAADGIEIEHYPPIIEKEVFKLVQSMFTKYSGTQTKNNNKRDGKNILQGVTKCARCGNAYTYAKRAKPVLACADAWKGSGCDNSSLQYKMVEETVLQALFEDTNINRILTPDTNQDRSEQRTLETKVAALRNEVQALTEHVSKIKLRGDLVPVSISISLSEYEVELQKEELKLSDVEIKYSKNDFKELKLTYQDIHNSTDVLKRARMQQFISRYVDKIEINSINRKLKIINIDVQGHRVIAQINCKPKVGYKIVMMKGSKQGKPL